MTDEINDAGSNPQELNIHVYAGADGSFILYEMTTSQKTIK